MSINIFGSMLSKPGMIGPPGVPGAPGAPGIGFNLTNSGDYDIQNKRLTNVSDPIEDQDAVNFKMFKDINQIGYMSVYLHCYGYALNQETNQHTFVISTSLYYYYYVVPINGRVIRAHIMQSEPKINIVVKRKGNVAI